MTVSRKRRTYVPDSQILNNQSRAAALGISIPGLSPSKAVSKPIAEPSQPKNTKEPVRRYTKSAYERELSRAPMEFTEKDANRLREERYAQNQGMIDSINSVFDQKLRGVQAEGETALNRNRAIASRSGLVGSGRGERQRNDVVEYNKEQEGYVEQQRMAEIQSVLFELDNRATQEIEARRLEAAGNRTAYLDFLKDAGEKARDEIKNLSGLGVTIDELAPEDIQDFMKYTGLGEDTLRLMWNAGLPQEDKIDYKYEVTENGVLAYGTDPKTGKLTSQYVDVPELRQGETLKEVDGVLYAIRKDASGGYSLRPLTQKSGEDVDVEGETGLRKEFNGLNTVSQFNTVQRAYTTIGSAYQQAVDAGKNKESKAAADQALIVAFNKMLDPGSVVREGEYARSVEGQSIINRLIGKAQAALQGGTGLTDADRKSIKDMVERVYGDYEKMYEGDVTKYRTLADQYGFDADRIVGAYTPRDEQTESYSSIDDYLDAHPEEDEAILNTFDALKAENPDATDEEIEQAILDQLSPSFSRVGNTSDSMITIPQTSRLAYVNNNPGNLKFAGQRGAVRGEKGFAKFETPEAGFEALIRQVNLDQNRGLTLSQFIHKFAPASENNTELYIKQLEQALGVKRGDKISAINARLLAQAVAKKESSTSFA